ncbi:MAG TPA: molybdate ABC transporter substrate-binding protein, partial [Gammaproteobacteria bacterium]
GKLYAQILHGAPYDIFLAADSKRPQKLEQENLIFATSRITYAFGKIALWSPKSNDPLRMLQQNTFYKMSIANPKTAPYGEAALQTLQHLNSYDAVKNKLVYGENIAQTYQFIESGSADLGFVALSQVNNSSSRYWLVPQSFYTPLEQQLVILKSSRNAALAKIFVEFMQQDSIKKLIRSHGYDTP